MNDRGTTQSSLCHSQQYKISPYEESADSREYQQMLHFHYNYYGRFINNLEEKISTERIDTATLRDDLKTSVRPILPVRTATLESNLLIKVRNKTPVEASITMRIRVNYSSVDMSFVCYRRWTIPLEWKDA